MFINNRELRKIIVLVFAAVFLAFGNIFAQKTAEEATDKGVDQARNGNYDAAITEFNRAIKIDSGYGYAYAYRGQSYAKKGDYDQAIADFTRSMELNLDPNFSAGVYRDRAEAYYAKGDFDRAISDYTKFLEVYTSFFDGYYKRGNAYAKKGDYDRAISDYNKALKIMEIFKNPDMYAVYVGRAEAYYHKQDYVNSWDDVHKVEKLGHGDKIDREFIDKLKAASGKEN
ncbi:MAG: tetratricopeptide repeat protein [Candidatus Omnitrophica bacterium]|nr:tetratricopeptide repeat protein [Candidatus Omnitrophota bacterium]